MKYRALSPWSQRGVNDASRRSWVPLLYLDSIHFLLDDRLLHPHHLQLPSPSHLTNSCRGKSRINQYRLARPHPKSHHQYIPLHLLISFTQTHSPPLLTLHVPLPLLSTSNRFPRNYPGLNHILPIAPSLSLTYLRQAISTYLLLRNVLH